MKKPSLLFLILIIRLFFTVPSVLADGLPPISNQQSYPIPQLYPIGQYPNPNYNPGPVNPKPQYPSQPPQTYPYEPQQQYYYSQPWQGQYPYDQNMVYDPYSGTYYYIINNDPGPYPFQPSYPYYPNRNVQVSKQLNYDGSLSLNWLLRNVTNEDWGKKNVDIKCISGCHLLVDPNRTLWDLPYSVPRNGTLSFTVNIWQPMYGETMTFSIVAGSKTIYTFDVNPN